MNLEEDFEARQFSFCRKEVSYLWSDKNLRDDFYKTRKDRGANPSAYAYECKSCTKWRVKRNKKRKTPWGDYPDW